MTNAYVDLKLVEEKVFKDPYIDIFMLKIN